jgi:hypothetical protein
VLVECNWIKENQRIYQESCKVTPGTADWKQWLQICCSWKYYHRIPHKQNHT